MIAKKGCVLIYYYVMILLLHIHPLHSLLQEVESEYNLATMVEMSSSVPKADPSQFELLKVLGQGSFGKVRACSMYLENIEACLLLPLSFVIVVRKSEKQYRPYRYVEKCLAARKSERTRNFP